MYKFVTFFLTLWFNISLQSIISIVHFTLQLFYDVFHIILYYNSSNQAITQNSILPILCPVTDSLKLV